MVGSTRFSAREKERERKTGMSDRWTATINNSNSNNNNGKKYIYVYIEKLNEISKSRLAVRVNAQHISAPLPPCYSLLAPRHDTTRHDTPRRTSASYVDARTRHAPCSPPNAPKPRQQQQQQQQQQQNICNVRCLFSNCSQTFVIVVLNYIGTLSLSLYLYLSLYLCLYVSVWLFISSSCCCCCCCCCCCQRMLCLSFKFETPCFTISIKTINTPNLETSNLCRTGSYL